MSKTRLYYGDKCFYRCPYLSTEKFADVGLRAEYHAYCHLSGEPVELTLKGNDAIRTSECKAMSPTALEITKTISIIVDEESAIQCNKDCPFCGVTIMNKEASITVRNAEYHVRTCEYNPDNKRCPTCKHWIRRYFPSRNACAIGEIVRDSDICFKHELKETKDES